MAAAGLLNSVLFHASNIHNNSQQGRASTFQQLGQDLQSGNLAAAQSDFALLTQNALGNQLSSANTINQAFNTLGQDLQSGNLAAAQRDYATLRQDLQQNSGSSPVHHHHHHHGGGSGQQTDPISVAFGSLGQALQSGNLAAAQQAYSTIQADLSQFASTAGIGGGATSSTPGLSTNSGFAVNA